MKLGTIAYDSEIYNLDYMTAEEVREVLDKIEQDKRKNIVEGKKLDRINSDLKGK